MDAEFEETGTRRRVSRVDHCQPRPVLGRLPWLALLRRARSLRFLVFLLIRLERVVQMGSNRNPCDPTRKAIGTGAGNLPTSWNASDS